MDTHIVLLMVVITMSMVITFLLANLRTKHKRIEVLSLQLEESLRNFQREKYRRRRVGSMDTR